MLPKNHPVQQAFNAAIAAQMRLIPVTGDGDYTIFEAAPEGVVQEIAGHTDSYGESGIYLQGESGVSGNFELLLKQGSNELTLDSQSFSEDPVQVGVAGFESIPVFLPPGFSLVGRVDSFSGKGSIIAQSRDVRDINPNHTLLTDNWTTLVDSSEEDSHAASPYGVYANDLFNYYGPAGYSISGMISFVLRLRNKETGDIRNLNGSSIGLPGAGIVPWLPGLGNGFLPWVSYPWVLEVKLDPMTPQESNNPWYIQYPTFLSNPSSVKPSQGGAY